MRASPLASLLALAIASSAAPATAQPQRLELDLAGTPLVMIRVSAGTFTQGSPPEEAGRNADEAPREVTLTRDFYLGEVPVLRGQFERFVQATGYRTESETGTSGGSGFDGQRLTQRPGFTWRNPGFAQAEDHPAVLLTYADAQRFLAWAGSVTGRALRLPTEAEWEYACRAGTRTPYYDATTADEALALGWFRAGSGDGTRPARGRRPNALGLYDLVGHVHQWTQDWYAPYPEGPASDPLQTAPGSPPGEPSRRVLRGGSWLRSVESGRCAARSRNTPGSRNADNGLRVAMDLSPPPQVLPPPSPVLPTPAEYLPPPSPPQQTWRNRDDGADLAVGLACCILGPGLLVALVVAVWLKRRGRSSRVVMAWGPAGPVRAEVTLQPVTDGFWILGHPSLEGVSLQVFHPDLAPRTESHVVYHHSARGMFVYTGQRPSRVWIGDTQGGAAAAAHFHAVTAHAGPARHRPSHGHGTTSHVEDHGYSHHDDHYDPPAY